MIWLSTGQRLRRWSRYWISDDNAVKCHQPQWRSIHHARASVRSDGTWLLVVFCDISTCTRLCVPLTERTKKIGRGDKSEATVWVLALFSLRAPPSVWLRLFLQSAACHYLGEMKMSCSDYRLKNCSSQWLNSRHLGTMRVSQTVKKKTTSDNH